MFILLSHKLEVEQFVVHWTLLYALETLVDFIGQLISYLSTHNLSAAS